MNEYQTNNTNVGNFISNVGRNWRNALYVTCSVCKYTKEKCCDDFLVSFDCEGRPTILTAKDASAVYGLMIDKSECIAEMSNVRFQELFENFINKRSCSPNSSAVKSRCPLLNAAEVNNF